MPTAAAAPAPLSRTYGSKSTGDLLTLLTTAVRSWDRTKQAEEIAAAAIVLQRRIGGRQTATGTRDTTDPAQELRERIDREGGFLATRMGQLRTALTSSPTPAPEPGYRHPVIGRPSYTQNLDTLGLDVFPSRGLAGISTLAVVYEAGLLLADLLTALRAGDDAEAQRLADEIRVRAGEPVLTA